MKEISDYLSSAVVEVSVIGSPRLETFPAESVSTLTLHAGRIREWELGT